MTTSEDTGNVEGLSPDAPILTNEKGGQQSKASYAFHLIPDEVYLALGHRFQYGQDRGYPRDNWMLIPAEEHFNHMMIHYLGIRKGDTCDDHFEAFICRAAMCFYMLRKENEPTITIRPTDEQIRTILRQSKGLITDPCETEEAGGKERIKCAGYMPQTSTGQSLPMPGQESEHLIL